MLILESVILYTGMYIRETLKKTLTMAAVNKRQTTSYNYIIRV